ncbi:MAG TPA: hypothetical protein VIA07_00620 [Desulfuromonadales bacterium]
MRTRITVAAAFMAAFMPFSVCRAAEDMESRLNQLDAELGRQGETIREQQKTIESLHEELAKQKGQETPAREAATPATKAGGTSGFFGGSALTNPYISLVLDTFAHTSDLKNDELESRGIPGFTVNGLEQQNGFNLRAAELFFFAPVDPYFNLYVNLPVTEDGIELEEAFAVTTAFPAGLQAKGGKFKSNFSRLDAQHPHSWDFTDIALPYRAFLGPEGLGGEKGVQVTWLPELPVYTQFGAEVLQGENDHLFGSDARSGPHAYSFFVKSSFDTTDDSTLYFGPSILFGKARNGSIAPDAEFSGNSTLYGMEAVWKWKPSKQQGLTIQGEYLYLNQHGNLEDQEAATVEPLRRRQDGAYLQALYQHGRWRLGARYDALELFADTFRLAGVQQDPGSTPWRATGALEFNPSEFTRIRLQYTHDRSGRDGRENNEGWLQFIFGIGAHGAHTF